jgi:phosphopantothenoylcysteine decarboxylase / phosphopantothenate---cysteine ligase
MGYYSNKRVLITAGPTVEMIDPVRFLSNRSSGVLGYALAKIARELGAHVTLVSGPTALEQPDDVEYVSVTSAEDMHLACMQSARNADIIIMAAAVADYRPEITQHLKMKKTSDHIQLTLVPTTDILAEVCRHRTREQLIVGFALESESLLENAKKKLCHKGCDIIIANDTSAIGAERHQVTIIDRHGHTEQLPAMPKPQLAQTILSFIASDPYDR